MKRRKKLLVLALALLTAAVAALALRSPRAPESSLTALVLRPEEGNAILVTCDREALLLPLGEGEELEELEDYLRRQRTLRVRYLICPEPDSAPALEAPALEKARQIAPSAQAEPLPLGAALCHLEDGGEGRLTLRILHGRNELRLRLTPGADPALSVNGAETELLDNEDCSTRFFSDGETVLRRPDFSVWDD